MLAHWSAPSVQWLRAFLLAAPLFVATAHAANPVANRLFQTVGCDSVDVDGLLSDAVDYALAAMSSISAISEGAIPRAGWADLKHAFLLFDIQVDDTDDGGHIVTADGLSQLKKIRRKCFDQSC
jgi:hypothetical protein